MEERTGKFVYFLKRYRSSATRIALPDGEEVVVVPPYGVEAGPAYKEEDGSETIYVDRNFYPDHEARVLHYASGRESADDGWELD